MSSLHVEYNEYAIPIIQQGGTPKTYKQWKSEIPIQVEKAYMSYIHNLILNNKGERPLKFDVWWSSVYKYGPEYLEPKRRDAQSIRDLNNNFGNRNYRN
jgi:hypothetical protein